MTQRLVPDATKSPNAPERTPRVLPEAPVGPASERRALGVLAMTALVAVIWVIQPVGIGMLVGTLNAFMMQSWYERLRRGGVRASSSAAIAVGVSTIGLVAVLAGIASLLVGRGLVLAGGLVASLSAEGPARGRLQGWAHQLDRVGLRADDLVERLRGAATDLVGRAAGTAANLASATMGALLGLLFVLMTTYFVLRHWTALARRAEELLPLHPRHTRALLDEFRIVGRTALLGTVLTGIAQGLLAAVGYLVTGTPEPAFLGAATAVASLIPAIGTLLVWAPAGVYLILTHHVAMGILELVWGMGVVVGICDYVIRPRLVGRGASMPALFTFAALFGGVETLGLIGLLVGPLVMALALAVLRIYAMETQPRHFKTTPP